MQKLFSVFFACVIMLSFFDTPVNAESTPWANGYAYALNDSMYNFGVMSAERPKEYFGTNVNGVIYGDLLEFNFDGVPMLVIFRANSEQGVLVVDIYGYQKGAAKLITSIAKPVNIADGNIGELSLGADGLHRYIIYREFLGENIINEEYYTVIDEDAFVRVDAPKNNIVSSGVVSFANSYLHPEVDISFYNRYLSDFFARLKDMSASSVEYEDIYDNITGDEKERISKVLVKTAGFDCFDIGDYYSMSEYSMAVKRHNGKGKLNAITNIYSLGEELYYVRYSTDKSFYNGAMLRRTDKVEGKYQILSVKNDFIPYSDSEIDKLKNVYLKNKLVLEKSSGSIELKNEPVINVNKLDIEKKFEIPQKISPSVRIPAAIIGGGLCLALIAALLIYILSDKNEK